VLIFQGLANDAFMDSVAINVLTGDDSPMRFEAVLIVGARLPMCRLRMR
jgi:hypothetical protein